MKGSLIIGGGLGVTSEPLELIRGALGGGGTTELSRTLGGGALLQRTRDFIVGKQLILISN